MSEQALVLLTYVVVAFCIFVGGLGYTIYKDDELDEEVVFAAVVAGMFWPAVLALFLLYQFYIHLIRNPVRRLPGSAARLRDGD